MKKIYILLVLLQINFIVRAATNIPAGSLGPSTWTLAGSPYLVAGTITVTSSLNIQPGVEVVFQGFAQLKVDGILRAAGTQAQPITFRRDDTTGWHNDIIQNGGWRGIYFNPYGGVDSSQLSYCIIKDTKHGVNAPMNDNAALYIYSRVLKVSHCEFYHCQSIANQSVGSIILGSMAAGQVFEMEYCNIHHNGVRAAVLRLDTYSGGYLKVHNNRFHHNTGGTVFTVFSELLFENNEVDSNTNYEIGWGTLQFDGGHNTIRGNKIHHNINQRLAAVACTMGKTTVEKNIICNNQMLDATCGLTDGGAAIHISHNNNGVWDSTEYIIRDNIIANNYANFYGAGIYIHSCKAWIYNNHIIKNKSALHGAGINVFGPSSQLYIQNNLFYGNESVSYGVKPDVYIASAGFYTFDYNWSEYPFYETLNASPGVVRNGDTIHNVTGANPQLANPTTICGHTEDAIPRDFHLLVNSTCIDKGNLQNIIPSATDYYGLNRVSGSKIDIGAHEFYKGVAEGINDTETFQVQLFPNPVTDKLKIGFADNDNYSIAIFDLSGKMVHMQNANNANPLLDMSIVPAGIYILSIENSNKKIVTRKVSKY